MIVAVLVAVAATAALLLGRRARTRRRGRAVERALPSLASDLARSVRSGATLRVALDELARSADPLLRPDLAAMSARVGRGHSLDRSLAEWARARATPSVDLLVGACRFGDAHGGDLARALDGAGAALLDAVELADESEALTAQARTSALVLVSLPPVGTAVFAVVDPSVAEVLLTTPAGWACLGVGLALDGLGLALSSWLVRAVTR